MEKGEKGGQPRLLPISLDVVMSLFDLLIVCLIILLLFGNRLPSMMRSLGRGVTEIKKGIARTEDNRDDPPTASGIFARIKPHPSGGTTAREPDSDKVE
jgi:sec-independent protein translocase protein TatA